MSELWVKYGPLSDSLILIIRKIIIVFHDEPEWVLLSLAIILWFFFIIVRFKAMESTNVSTNILENSTRGEVDLDSCCLSLPSHYTLISVENISEVLVFDVKWCSLNWYMIKDIPLKTLPYQTWLGFHQ
jgi:hypothetical protein